MTEKKGPFDAAIAILGLTHYRTDIHPTVQKMIDDAIRVLKATGKIDRDRTLRVLATLLKVYVISGQIIPELEQDLKDGMIREIRALFQALPDAEGEKK